MNGLLHPHCLSVRAEGGAGERVDTRPLEVGQPITVAVRGDERVLVSDFDTLLDLGFDLCEFVDESVSRPEGHLEPPSWTCPQCGGVSFDWVTTHFEIR
jgi:hypothetical protein